MMEFDTATNDNDVYRKIFASRRDPYLLDSGRNYTEINIDDLYPVPTQGQK